MLHDPMIIGLVSMTFLAVIAWAVWQKRHTKKSQEKIGDPHGHKATHDALTAHHPDNPQTRR